MKYKDATAKIVSVHSFRGGTGKSNTTSNLATTIACYGNRVGIIDTDIQSPGVHALFGLDEEKIDYALNDYLWGNCVIEEAAYDVSQFLQLEQGRVVAPNSAVYLVPSSIKATKIARILNEGYDVELLNNGFQKLIHSLKLDYLFIDTHPGINEETLLSIAMSDILVLILRPDTQDYQGTAVAIDIACELEVPKMLLVVNKVLTKFDFEALQQKVQTAYNVPVAGVFPLCEEMVELASNSIFCLRYPEHPWTQEIDKVARQILS
ncbi:CDP-3,6-dideoxy-D-glycero-L-glycero-4-hexulose-4-reductase [Nostoc minutum NIES-26]|uniref:CDP-3, 6-dideoxy-D-glycero-L-glycero-4-hexulose-4-reductase n=1 Tax=Nostoc minutum NIES-26 TaxID=1844469 RepID=A0A367RZW8_9NOSO|nr:CDP-3,6-dideoxy-D-glycero-L-glycero-4-hexulose-4-reductase [Nostoc minutum NIES-26]